jgi:UDP-2-acetamido-3-amino-2,3-dideoxy-glucuronate N-acetyltransferase
MLGSTVVIHPSAICETEKIGEGTRVWAFAHVLPGAVIGNDCNICDHVFIENDVRIGHRVTVKCGVQLWDGISIEDDVFIGPNATFTNDRFPRSRRHLNEHPKTVVRDGASIGANATILPGVEIGRQAMVGAGAVVTHDVPPFAIVYGNPARIGGYVGAGSDVGEIPDAQANFPKDGCAEAATCRVRGVEVIELDGLEDLRGELVAAECGKHVPFVPKRVFFVSNVPSAKVRGEHAHRECEQLLVCISGSVNLMVDDGVNREEFTLDSPSMGVYIAPMVWAAQFQYSHDAVLCVLASHPYDADDYLRDYENWREAAEGLRE